MPRLKKSINPDEAFIRAWLSGGMAAAKLSQGELARRSGIPASTLSKRVNQIETFTVSEILAILNVFRKAGVAKETYEVAKLLVGQTEREGKR